MFRKKINETEKFCNIRFSVQDLLNPDIYG